MTGQDSAAKTAALCLLPIPVARTGVLRCTPLSINCYQFAARRIEHGNRRDWPGGERFRR